MISRRDYLRASAVAVPAISAGTILSTASPVAAAPLDPVVPRLARPPFLLGMHLPYTSATDLAINLRRREEQIARALDVVLVFARIGDPVSSIVPSLMQSGYEVALCLEWWGKTSGPADPAYALTRIAAGAFDADTRRWAQWMRSLPRPLHVRPLHEGNGDWYPWGVYSGTNRPADFAPAFRRVATVLRADAGDRARIQWCVNRKNGKDKPDPIAAIFPGDDVVDEFVINGYDRPEYPTATTFAEVFAPMHRQLKAISTTKSLWIGETAATELHGDKAGWIRAMFATLRTSMVVDCLTWFDKRIAPTSGPVRDWPIDTSPAALAAFAGGAVTGRGFWA